MDYLIFLILKQGFNFVENVSKTPTNHPIICSFKCTLWKFIIKIQYDSIAIENDPFIVGDFPVRWVQRASSAKELMTSSRASSEFLCLGPPTRWAWKFPWGSQSLSACIQHVYHWNGFVQEWYHTPMANMIIWPKMIRCGIHSKWNWRQSIRTGSDPFSDPYPVTHPMVDCEKPLSPPLFSGTGRGTPPIPLGPPTSRPVPWYAVRGPSAVHWG